MQNDKPPARDSDMIGECWPQRRNDQGNVVVVNVPDQVMLAAAGDTRHSHSLFTGWFGIEEPCPVCSYKLLARLYQEIIPNQTPPHEASKGPHLHVACVRCRDWASTNRYGQMKGTDAVEGKVLRSAQVGVRRLRPGAGDDGVRQGVARVPARDRQPEVAARCHAGRAVETRNSVPAAAEAAERA